MQGSKTLGQHEILMRRMASTLGVDLDEAELRGDLPAEERDVMLFACTGCSNPERCQTWLDKTQSASEAPGYCRNADQLRWLAGRD